MDDRLEACSNVIRPPAASPAPSARSARSARSGRSTQGRNGDRRKRDVTQKERSDAGHLKNQSDLAPSDVPQLQTSAYRLRREETAARMKAQESTSYSVRRHSKCLMSDGTQGLSPSPLATSTDTSKRSSFESYRKSLAYTARRGTPFPSSPSAHAQSCVGTQVLTSSQTAGTEPSVSSYGARRRSAHDLVNVPKLALAALPRSIPPVRAPARSTAASDSSCSDGVPPMQW